MKMEYGYRYKYQNVFENVIQYDRLFNNPVWSHIFSYRNALEDLSIYKNLLIMTKRGKENIEFQEPSSLVKDERGLGESQSSFPLDKEIDEYKEYPFQTIFNHITGDFLFHSYHQLAKAVSNEYNELSEQLNLNAQYSYTDLPSQYHFGKEIDFNKMYDEQISFNVQHNLNRLENTQYRFDSIKNLLKSNELNSFKYFNSLMIYGDGNRFDGHKQIYKKDTIEFFNKENTFKHMISGKMYEQHPNDLNVVNVFNVEKIKYSAQSLGHIGLINTPIKKGILVDDLNALSKYKDISVILNNLWTQKRKYINVFESIFANKDSLNIAELRYYSMKNMNIIDIATKNNLMELYQAKKTIDYFKTVTIGTNIKIANILYNNSVGKYDKNLFSNQNVYIYKGDNQININNYMLVDKGIIDANINSILFSNKGKDYVYIDDALSIYKDLSKHVNVTSLIGIRKSYGKEMLLNSQLILNKAAFKKLSTQYDNIFMQKVKKHLYKDSELLIYREGQPDTHLYDDVEYFKKDSTYDVGVNSVFITYVNQSKALMTSSNASFNRMLNKHLSLSQNVAVEIEKKVNEVKILYEELIDITRSVNMNYTNLITFAKKTDYILSLANKFKHLSDMQRNLVSQEDFINLLANDKDVMLAMLGINLGTDYNKDLFSRDYSKNLDKSSKKSFNTIQKIDLSKSSKHSLSSNVSAKLSKEAKDQSNDRNTLRLANVHKEVKPLKIDELLFTAAKKPKETGNANNGLNMDKISGEINSEALKSSRFTSIINDISTKESEIYDWITKYANVGELDNVFISFSKMLEVETDNITATGYKMSRDVATNKDEGLGMKILRNFSNLPYIEDLIRDPIARDIITMELPQGGTVDDEFIHHRASGLDELLLPTEDFDYSKFKTELFDYTTGQPINPVRRINDTTFIAKYPVDHAIGFGAEIGRKYVDVNVYTLKFLLEIFYVTWQQRMFEFGTMDLRTGIQQMLKYMEIFIEYRIPPNIQEEAWRCYNLIRWYAEAVIMYNSTYQITFQYKPWKSELDTGIISCPHTLTDVIINSGYVLENTATHSEIELQQEVKKEGWIQFDVRLFDGQLNVYLNTIKVETIERSKRFRYPIQEGPLNVRLEFNGSIMRVGNIVIDNCEFDDIVTEYHMEPGKANLGMDLITKRICTYFEVTNANFEDMKAGIQGSLSLRDLSNRLIQYFDEHHKNKTKGKRLTIKKGML